MSTGPTKWIANPLADTSGVTSYDDATDIYDNTTNSYDGYSTGHPLEYDSAGEPYDNPTQPYDSVAPPPSVASWKNPTAWVKIAGGGL